MKVRFRGESQLDSRGVELLIGLSESLRGRQILSDATTVSNTILHCNIILEQVFFYFGINVLVKEKEPDHWGPASFGRFQLGLEGRSNYQGGAVIIVLVSCTAILFLEQVFS